MGRDERKRGGDGAPRTAECTSSAGGGASSTAPLAETTAETREGGGTPAEPRLAAGTVIGEYVVERTIGSGGFGTVYEARQPVIEKRVAIKLLAAKYSADPRSVIRFVAEARVTNQIGHPNILGVFSFGRLDDGRHYHITDFVPGETLQGLLERRGKLQLAEALPILSGIASALEAAHAAGVVHRDLKPANVLLATHGDARIPKVIDFGIAKLLGDEPQGGKTRSGVLMGTPLYMSPEQCRGRSVDQRSDVYAFGVVAYQMLTGQPPFDAEDVVDILLQHTSKDPEPPSHVAEGLPPEVDPLILGLLAKEPSHRPASTSQVVSELQAIAKRGPSIHLKAEKPRTVPALLLLACVVGLGGFAVARRSPQVAETVPRPDPSGPAVAAAAPSAATTPPRRVRIEISGPPDGTQVRSGSGRLLGTAPGAIDLERAETPVDLELSRAGYSTTRREVTPAGDQRLEVRLQVLSPPAAKPKAARAPAPDPDDTEQPKW